MGFMQAVVQHGEWIEVDGRSGIEVIPADIVDVPSLAVALFKGDAEAAYVCVRDYLETHEAPSLDGYTFRTGYGARMSAPGYMDCTPWAVYDTEAEARLALSEEYSVDIDDDDAPEGWDRVDTSTD